MPSPSLLSLAPPVTGDADAELTAAIAVLHQVCELEWFTDAEDLKELAELLRNGGDMIIQEAGFEPIGDKLHVSFLDDSADCDPAQFIHYLDTWLTAIALNQK